MNNLKQTIVLLENLEKALTKERRVLRMLEIIEARELLISDITRQIKENVS